MRNMSGNEIRQEFLDFFEKKGHLIMPSASLVPQNDPSLLLVGAGMAPFKAYFTGTAQPPAKRIATSQKCIRTPDIERVGKTARHATFFEMLGNFSFGDYFKKDAIFWAWEFLTDVIEMDPQRLYITVHQDDQEAYDIWHQEVGIPAERIYLGDDEENFWEIGVGPSGPCSEIFYDQGEEYSCGDTCQMGCDCDRYLEVWNLVFTQYDKDEDGNYNPLERKSIDTGMGLDRLAAVVQGKSSIFEIDLNYPMLERLIELSKIDYDGQSKESLAARVIIDHIKGVTFLIADGVLPANEGRGYVLRRLLRRAIRNGRLIGLNQPFTQEIAKEVIKSFSVGYPDLLEKEEFILQLLALEEKRFNETLEAGLNLVQQFLTKMWEQKEKTLAGEAAFRLHDTFGFPLELTQEILAESGFSLDIEGFKKEMEKQRQRARAARSQVDAMGSQRLDTSGVLSLFRGYEVLEESCRVEAIYLQGEKVDEAKATQQVKLVLNPNPFYGESGGQVGDIGSLLKNDLESFVSDTESIDEVQVLQVELAFDLVVGEEIIAKVDAQRRAAIARHHSATHLLHKALSLILGDHVHQAGSWVGPDRLRFDFSHFNSISAEELKQIEDLVNRWIMENHPVLAEEMTLDQAKEQHVTALFGEKYSDIVRVVKMGESQELCGGTHVRATGEIGPFKILSEASIGSGVRRIEALAGFQTLDYYAGKEELLLEISALTKSKEEDIIRRIQSLQEQVKEQERQLASLSAQNTMSQIDNLISQKIKINGVDVLALEIEADKTDDLRHMADLLRDKMGSGIVVLGSNIEGKASLLAAATKDLKDLFHAGNLIREAAKLVGGGGGGRPDLAQAGGPSPEKLKAALPQIIEMIKEQMKEKN